jgi:hypothetical protein
MPYDNIFLQSLSVSLQCGVGAMSDKIGWYVSLLDSTQLHPQKEPQIGSSGQNIKHFEY